MEINEMTPNRSHPSRPLPSIRKPRAISPRTKQDFNLLATTVANWGVPTPMISRRFGSDDDYAERLLRSGPGLAFTDWLKFQPADFVRQFDIIFDEQIEPKTQIKKILTPDPRRHVTATAEAIANIYGTSVKDD